MAEAPVTRASLILRIRDGQDHEAWRQFVQAYAPVVYGFVRKRGVQDADAADLMQEVFRAVANAMPRMQYDPGRGTFRGWLYTVTRNKLYNFLSARTGQEKASGDSGAQERLEEQPAPDDSSDQWDREYERGLFSWAAERVRPEFQEQTWQAFWQTAVDGNNPKAVAAGLGMSPGAVYVAKSRVLARLREKVQEMQDDQ